MVCLSDVFDKNMRSVIMRKVRSKGNKSTETRLIGIFSEQSIKGWRRNYPVKGHPDFIFPKKKIAMFVDGCFWHGHDCRNTRPKQNKEYWQTKRERNIAHDIAISEEFRQRGWLVLRIWECELKKANLPALIDKLHIILNEQIH